MSDVLVDRYTGWPCCERICGFVLLVVYDVMWVNETVWSGWGFACIEMFPGCSARGMADPSSVQLLPFAGYAALG